MKRNKRVAIFVGGSGFLVGLLLMGAARSENPPVARLRTIEAATHVPAEVEGTLRRACFDCHSNETRWPWYARLPVASSMIAADVENGRMAMNFSDWPEGRGDGATYAAGLLLGACEAARSARMPPPRYLALHPGARLSRPEVEALCAWSRSEAAGAMLAGGGAKAAAAE